MKKSFCVTVFSLFIYIATCFVQSAIAQPTGRPTSYYLPSTEYNAEIQSPETFFGFEIGEWHLNSDQIQSYFYYLASVSNRIQIKEYAKSYQGKPLIHAVVSTPENIKQLDSIIEQHKKLANPNLANDVDINTAKVISWMGYSIHGNEPSGANASVLVAYYLAANKSVLKQLEDVVVVMDPSLNPDGLNRFASWVNSNKSFYTDGDPNNREQNEMWPRGRTNHYWFDLNRDWLLVQHPESRGRIKEYQKWLPNVLTDHHEMGTNSTFYFMPGIPSRTNPLTPKQNQELTARIAEYQAVAVDSIKSLYYTKESFDDFYYGKGSTYPDVQGGIGILFEQASSRSHRQQSQHGVLDFSFTVRNQVVSSITTVKASSLLKDDLLSYFKNFYKKLDNEARESKTKAYLLGDEKDQSKINAFVDLLLHHNVQFYDLAKETSFDGIHYKAGNAILIPTEENNSRFLEALFSENTTFTDSLFYDVSAWSFQHSFDLDLKRLSNKELKSVETAAQIIQNRETSSRIIGDEKNVYSYVFRWNDYYAPRLAYKLMADGLLLKVSDKAFTANVNGKEERFEAGSIQIATGIQPFDKAELKLLIDRSIKDENIDIFAISSGLSVNGIDLGSPSFNLLEKPKVAVLVDGGASSSESGEVWHLFDQRFKMPITRLDSDNLIRTNLDTYNTLVIPSGYYDSSAKAAIEAFANRGGTVILLRSAVSWAARNKLIDASFKDIDNDTVSDFPTYADYASTRGAQVTGGSIFKVNFDPTHPLAYGIPGNSLATFRNHNNFMEIHKNPYGSPFRYTDEPLVAGYISKQNLDALRGTAMINVYGTGSGKVIAFVDNPNFRAFWYGTNKLFMNAIFFGRTISSGTIR